MFTSQLKGKSLCLTPYTIDKGWYISSIASAHSKPTKGLSLPFLASVMSSLFISMPPNPTF